MAKVLFLFSKTFPYGSGEQYIENEIPFLAQKFDKVLIYPADWFATNGQHQRVLPPNVEVFDLNLRLDPRNKVSLFSALGLVISDLFHSRSFLKDILRFKYLLGIARHQWFTAKNFLDHLEKEHAADELFFYCYWLHNSAIMLAILKQQKQISSFVARAHSIDLYHHDWALAAELKVPALEYTKISHATAIYPVSRHGENFLKNKFKDQTQKIKYAYLGVTDEGINTASQDTFTIVTCANLTANKRMLELGKAVEQVEIPITWIHFGEGEQRAEIEKIADSLPPSKKIILKGNVPNSEVRKFLVYQPADLFVNLSIVEGLPVSLMEAASAGIPLLATRVCGSPEIVKDGVSGYTLPVNFTIGELAELLIKIKKDPATLQKLGEGARRLYLEHFKADQNYTAFADELLNYKNKIA